MSQSLQMQYVRPTMGAAHECVPEAACNWRIPPVARIDDLAQPAAGRVRTNERSRGLVYTRPGASWAILR